MTSTAMPPPGVDSVGRFDPKVGDLGIHAPAAFRQVNTSQSNVPLEDSHILWQR